MDKAAKSAPSGSEFAFTAVKQAVTAANQAYDALSKAGKQVVDMTEATSQRQLPVLRARRQHARKSPSYIS